MARDSVVDGHNQGRRIVRSNASARAGSRSIPILLALAVGLVVLAGCGSSSKSSSSSTTAAAPAPTTTTSSTPAPATGGTTAAQKLSLTASAEGQLKYNTSSLTAKAGAVKIDFTNMAPLAHDVTVATASGAVVGATPQFQGGSKTLSLNLKPGKYTFYCSVPGHRQAGMEGTLTVQ
jgi:plastocyanin